MKLFVTATNVRTCKSRLFRTPEITAETLLASACLPLLFEAVEIDGEFYWDGGYLGNPAISPLINECMSNDVVIVQINPMNRPDVPETAREILNRINEMTFNASLVREMAGIAAITQLVESGKLNDDRYVAVRFHEIGAEIELAEMGALSQDEHRARLPRAPAPPRLRDRRPLAHRELRPPGLGKHLSTSAARFG